jgi:PTS system mannose-specific IIA component
VIGVVLVSHGALARALLETAAEIVGPFPNAEALEVTRKEPIEEVRTRIRGALQRRDQGDGVLVIADMFGGTAANVSLEFVGKHRLEVVTGANLPMLLKLSSEVHRAHDVLSLAQLLKFYGQKNVVVASEVLKEREIDA